jgi:hypothetical protein
MPSLQPSRRQLFGGLFAGLVSHLTARRSQAAAAPIPPVPVHTGDYYVTWCDVDGCVSYSTPPPVRAEDYFVYRYDSAGGMIVG